MDWNLFWTAFGAIGGTVALDESTGLSCHWFWLMEPHIYQMKKV